ncbi:hypothetical protein ES708_33640 [subsurface metagenome]
MAKPKSPLLSLGARGSIGDTLTFQKRGRLTIARQKPIPTDPKTDLQLAQRQVYREAVAAWNALTPEDQEAYRGVCPGLTPYQCFMKTALAPAPPEEQIEQQTEHDAVNSMYAGSNTKIGQRLIIPNRKVTKLGFWIYKSGTPTGDVTYEIRLVTGDSLISSKFVSLIQDLPEIETYTEIEFDDPQTIDGEARIVVCFEAGSPGNALLVAKQNSDVKADEHWCRYKDAAWTPNEANDTAYRYKYYEVE